MRRIHAVLIAAAMLSPAVPATAQDSDGGPHLPSAPEPRLPEGTRLPAGPLGVVSSTDLLVTSSANDHGSYLWIVGPAQHIVILCEKTDPAPKDFSCTTKRLP